MAKKIRRITDLGTISQATFADSASVTRVAESGLDWTILGALDSAKRVGKACPLLIYNKDTSVHFVAFGAQAMSAPTSETDGIPIMPGVFIVNSGDNEWIRSDSNKVFGYKGDVEPV